MPIIQELSQDLANQIAAGEVVERPASVVKELVENAIDAGASHIIIEVTEGGIYQVRVTDDGQGMEAEDLVRSIRPHATSKIYKEADLFQIQSLGFRGEALASISSVAKLRIESTHRDQADQGNYIEVHQSQIKDQGPTSPRPGTMVQVDSLFYNTPARLKHLKSLKTELQHIISFVHNIALSFPEIRFELISDGRRIFQSSGNGDLRQAIANVYQPQIARDLLEIQTENFDFKLWGYVSPPTLTRSNNRYIHWMINGRTIRNYQLDQALIKAYGRQLMVGRYPISIIHIEADPRLVDANVHPRKQTVRLSNIEDLTSLLSQAVEDRLAGINPIPSADLSSHPTQSRPALSQQLDMDQELYYRSPANQTAGLNFDQDHDRLYQEDRVASPTSLYQQEVDQPLAKEENSTELDQASDLTTSAPTQQAEESLEAPVASSRLDFAQLRYVGQIHGTYLIAESIEGFYLIDQHAAQERIRYQAMMKETVDSQVQQELLIPMVLHFNSAQANQIDQVQDSLQNLGIYLEPFGPTSYQLQSYPTWLLADEVEKTVYDLVDLLMDQPDLTVNQLKEQSIIMKSCRGAIKANHPLDKDQALALIRQLRDLEDPYHCPHGRPVLVAFDQATLEKLFKRIPDAKQRGGNIYD